MRMKPMKEYINAVWLIAAVLIISGGLNGGCATSSSMTAQLDHSREQAVRQMQTSTDHSKIVKGLLSIDQAINYALDNNQALNAIRQNSNIARATSQSSYSGFLPNIVLSGSYTRLDDELEDQEENGSLDQYDIGISLKQALFRGGASLAERNYADWNTIYVAEQIRAETETVIYQVVGDYYAVLLAGQLLKVAEDAVISAEAYLDDVMRKQANGAATEYAVLRARVDVSLYQAEKLQQQNLLNMSRTRLLQRIGMSQQSVIELSDQLTFTALNPVYDQAIREAWLNRPDLRRQQADVYRCKARLRKAWSRYSPEIDAIAEQHWGRPDPHESSDDSWGDDYLVGIEVSLPLFDGLIRESEVSRDQARLDKTLIQLEDLQEKAALDVQQALLRLRDAERFVQTQKMNLTYAHEGLRLADVGYAQGIYTEIDVTDARAALTKAQGLHFQAVYDHATAVLMFRKAVGQLTPLEVTSHAP